MKKKFVFIVLIVCVYIIAINRKNITVDDEGINKIIEENVFNYINNNINYDYEFNNFYLLFDEYNLNTSNFVQLFSFFKEKDYEYRIIEIIPYVNPTYINLFSKKSFLFYTEDLYFIVNKFLEDYKKTHYTYERNATINNICIKMVKINTANKYIKEFLTINNNIKYRKPIEKKFRTL